MSFRRCRPLTLAAGVLTTAVVTLSMINPAAAAPLPDPTATASSSAPSGTASASTPASAAAGSSAGSAAGTPTASGPSSSASSSASATPTTEVPAPSGTASSASTPATTNSTTASTEAAQQQTAAQANRRQVGATSEQLRALLRTGQFPQPELSRSRSASRADAPEVVIFYAVSSCAPSGGTGAAQFFVLSDGATDPVEWTVRGSGGFVRTGTVDPLNLDEFDEGLDPEDLFVDVDGVPLGDLTLEIRSTDDQTLLDQTDLTVLHCVSTTAVPCQATFTNPNANPPVTVLTDDADRALGATAEVGVGPGQTRTITAESSTILWGAIRSTDLEEPAEADGGDDGESLADYRVVFNLAGTGEINLGRCTVPLITVTAGCIGPGQNAEFAVDLPAGSLRQRDIRVIFAKASPKQTPVTVKGSGAGTSGRYSFATGGLSTGSYLLRLETTDSTQIIAFRSFALMECVETRVQCRSVTFSNPAGNPVAVIRYSGGRVRVPAGDSRTITSSRRTLDWTGTGRVPELDEPLTVAYGELERDAVAIPAATGVDLRRNCAAASGNGSAPGGMAAGGLADTGSSTTAATLGLIGLGAFALGSALLLIGRRRRTL